MKTYVLLVSRTFPKGHKREGEETFFVKKILNNLTGGYCYMICKSKNDCKLCSFEKYSNEIKRHTCRKNYELWAKRIKEVQEGKAILSLRYWQDERGRSVKGNEQVEFARLGKYSGVGVQELCFINSEIERPCIFDKGYAGRENIKTLAKNDGLSIDDFKDWFKNYDFSKPMAIIQFTEFRY